ncbi:MAG: glycosyltransferase [Lachnospiraceae bacterium]|nr:glycosyltransferase [Lachnospiraceae bacterium]
MRILFVNLFVSYTSQSLIRYFKEMGHSVKEVTHYTPEDYYRDDRLYGLILEDIRTNRPDFVFTVNIWPLVARACHEKRLPYLAWSYDSPQNLLTDEDLSYDTNWLFLFDRTEVEMYRKRGIEKVYHLPLAADVARWEKINPREGEAYEVSLLGSLYESTLPPLMQAMSDYHRGYIQAVLEAQKKVYGYYLVDDVLTEELLTALNEDLNRTPGKLQVNKAQMAYSMGTFLTYSERLTLLMLLKDRCDMHLFSGEINERIRSLLRDVHIHGWASYDAEMPRVFKASKINLNPSLRIIRSGIPLRCMDIMGCGGFLLSSYQPELAEYFAPDEEVVLYDSMEDAVEKTLFYLEHEDLRRQIAERGYEKVKAEFTYPKQIEKMLATAGLK